MAEYCRKYFDENGQDPIYWDPKDGPRAPKRGYVMQILCEGHGAFEWIDFDGYPVDSIPYWKAQRVIAQAPRSWTWDRIRKRFRRLIRHGRN